MGFHRYTTPTYFGGLPGGYDFINVTSGGTGAGGSSFADNAKVGGPNAGSYFVAFGEDATSSNANRGMRALAQNCDSIDDILHKDIASPVRTANATAGGGGVASVTLPTATYLGNVGYTTSTADLARLYSIVDSNDNEIIIQASGAKVQVTSVTLGGGDQIGGGGANGAFSGNTVQLNIAPSIPAGVVYRIYYGTRTNLASLSDDVFTTIKIRTAEEVSAPVEDLFRQLHGNNESWNAVWDTTIFDLGVGGLNERYNRASATPIVAGPDAYFISPDLDIIGNGAWIVRSGPAVTVYANNTGAYSDPLNALFMAKFYDHTPANSGGAVGYGVYGARQTGTAWTGETANRTPGGASFMHLWPHYFQNTIHASNPLTRIVDGAAASLIMVGGFNVNTGESIVQVTAAGNYFRTGGSQTAIAIGYDLIECTYVVGGVTLRRTFVIVCHGATTDLTNVTKVRVRNLDGTVPDFTGASGATIRWISASFLIADGAASYHSQKFTDVSPVRHGGLFYQVPPSLSAVGGDDDVPRTPASFSAQSVGAGVSAVQWGGFSPLSDLIGNPALSGPTFQGFLRGDGSLDALEVRAYGTLSTQGAIVGNYHLLVTEDKGSHNTNPQTIALNMALGSSKKLICDTTNSAVTTLNITGIRSDGVYRFYLDHSGGPNTNNVNLVWAGAGLTHRFGPGDSQPSLGNGRDLWVGYAITATEILWTVTRYT